MKNVKKILLAVVCGIISFAALFGISACKGEPGEAGKSAYDIAVENGFKGTEAEWLESLKSESAYDIWIKSGHRGTEMDFLNWLKGERGDQGEQGEKGDDGKDGKDGHNSAWLVGETLPYADEGNDGDLYLDYSTWDVWYKLEGKWIYLGNIKGETLPKEQAEAVLDFGELTLAPGQQSKSFSLRSLEMKNYYIIADTGSEPEPGTLTAIVTARRALPTECDMFTPITHRYKCVANIGEGWFESRNYCFFKIRNDSEDEIKLRLKVIDYNEFTIEAGKKYEIAAIAPNNGQQLIPISEELTGKPVKITVLNFSGKDKLIIYYDGKNRENITGDDRYSKEITIPAGTPSVAFVDWNDTIQNIVVRFDLV